MKHPRYLLLLLVAGLLTSCVSSYQSVTVNGPQGTSIYNLNNQKLGVIGSNNSTTVSIPKSSALLLSQAPGSNTKIPFALDYKGKKFKAAMTPWFTGIGAVAGAIVTHGIPEAALALAAAGCVSGLYFDWVKWFMLEAEAKTTKPWVNIKLLEQSVNSDIQLTQPVYTEPEKEPLTGSSIAGSPASGMEPDMWTGTGFAMRNGYIVTNNHVIDGAKTITVMGVNGNTTEEYNAVVVAVDKNNDLALIRIRDAKFYGFDNLPYAIPNTQAEVGSDVFVLGYPMTQYMGDEVKLTNGIISSRTGYQNDVSTYQISAPVQPGNSGGPMFDKDGNIIGIVNAGIPGAENVGYAIKTSYLYNLVNSVESENIIPKSNHVVKGDLPEKVKQLKSCVFFIKCVGE